MIKKRNEILIILEIPHYHEPKIWVAYNEIDITIAAFDGGLLYRAWTKEMVIDNYGENKEDWPDHFLDYLKNLENGEEVIQVSHRRTHEGDFYSIDEAPCLYESAVLALSSDLQSLKILTIDEAKDFVKNYKEPHSSKVIDAINNQLEILVNKYKFHELALWQQIAIHRQTVKKRYDISCLIDADYIKKENDYTYTVRTSERNCTFIYINFSKKHKDWAIEQARLWRKKEVTSI